MNSKVRCECCRSVPISCRCANPPSRGSWPRHNVPVSICRSRKDCLVTRQVVYLSWGQSVSVRCRCRASIRGGDCGRQQQRTSRRARSTSAAADGESAAVTIGNRIALLLINGSTAAARRTPYRLDSVDEARLLAHSCSTIQLPISVRACVRACVDDRHSGTANWIVNVKIENPLVGEGDRRRCRLWRSGHTPRDDVVSHSTAIAVPTIEHHEEAEIMAGDAHCYWSCVAARDCQRWTDAPGARHSR